MRVLFTSPSNNSPNERKPSVYGVYCILPYYRNLYSNTEQASELDDYELYRYVKVIVKKQETEICM